MIESTSGSASAAQNDGAVIVRVPAPQRASELTVRPAEWLWPKRIPIGGLTVLAGEPGLGKSLLSLQLAARLSRSVVSDELGTSLLLTAEDAREQTVLPRLVAAGADLERVLFPARLAGGVDELLRIPDQIELLRAYVVQEAVRLLVIDPLVAYLPAKMNPWADKSVRGALAPLAAMAEDLHLAVVLVAHLNKAEGADPLRRLGGSIGLAAAARSVLLIARDPDDPLGVAGSQRVLAQVKNNLAKLQPSLAYRVEATAVAGVEDEVAVIRETGDSRFTGEQLLALNQPEVRSKLEDAQALLVTMLAEGVRPVSELTEAARELGISESTLNRAKEQLGVRSIKLDLRRWGWELPELQGESVEAAAA